MASDASGSDGVHAVPDAGVSRGLLVPDAFDSLLGGPDCLYSDPYGSADIFGYRDTLSELGIGRFNGDNELPCMAISSGDELFPGATSIELLETEEVESSPWGTKGPGHYQHQHQQHSHHHPVAAAPCSGGGSACGWLPAPSCSKGSGSLPRAPSPGTPDSMQSQASAQSFLASPTAAQAAAQQAAWRASSGANLQPAGSLPEPLLDHKGWPGLGPSDPCASSAATSPLVRSASCSRAGSLTSLWGYQQDLSAPAVIVPVGPSLPTAAVAAAAARAPTADHDQEPAAAAPAAGEGKRAIVRPRRSAAYVTTLPSSPRGDRTVVAAAAAPAATTAAAASAAAGKKRGAPGSAASKVAPNPEGHACTSCGAQSTPVWRAGPQGPKTLCNACGCRLYSAQVRYMKVAKRK